jgi:DNA-binding NtrC family response regulator
MEPDATESLDTAAKLKLGILKTLVRTVITELEVLENGRLSATTAFDGAGVDFYEEVTRFEIQLIHDALMAAAGQQQRAAELLKLKPTTLNNLIKKYRIPWRSLKVAVEAESPSVRFGAPGDNGNEAGS